MNLLLTGCVIQVFFPFIAGLLFVFFNNSGEIFKKNYVSIFSWFYVFLTGLIFLWIRNKSFVETVNIGELSLSFQGKIYFFLFCSSLGYLVQGKKIILLRDNVSIIFLFHSIFFFVFNLSIFSSGLIFVYIIIEILCFFLMVLTVFSKNSWDKKNTVLQSIGTALIASVFVILPSLEEWGAGDKIFLEKIFSSLFLLGLLLKSTLLEFLEKKRERDELSVYFIMIKLYIPARILCEFDDFIPLDLGGAMGVVLLCLALFNCMGLEKLKGKIEGVDLATLFGWVVVVGFVILGIDHSFGVIKHTFFLLLLFLFYESLKRSKHWSYVCLILFILSLVGVFSSFFQRSLSPVLLGGGKIVTAIFSAVIIYAMLQIIWKKMVVEVKK